MTARVVAAATRPATSLNLVRDAAEGLGELVWAGLNPAPETPLNVTIGPHRRFAVARQQLSDYKEIKDALGGTVNDVVLTVVAGALAGWLRSRGVRTQGLEMRALVPVSVRPRDQRGALGNQLTAMRGPLPVYIDDPVARLRYVRAAMDGLKESKQAVGAATLVAVNNLAPPTILAQASRLNFSTRLFNLLVTNVPGPQLPLYVLGRELKDLFPVAFLPENHALAIAIMSYNGNLDYGLLGDYDAMPDIDIVADGIERSLAALLAAARGGRSRPPRPSGRGSDAGPGAATPAARRRRRPTPASGTPTPATPAAPGPGTGTGPAGADRARGPQPHARPGRRHARQARAGQATLALTAPQAIGLRPMTDEQDLELIKPGQIAYHLDLTAAQLKIVHTALKSLRDDLGRERARRPRCRQGRARQAAVRSRHPRDRPRPRTPRPVADRSRPAARWRDRRPARSRARTWRRRSSAPATRPARTSASTAPR